jgi:hypothetical protein
MYASEERTLTFAAAYYEVSVDASETTSNDMVTLSLPSEFASKSSRIEIPQVNLLAKGKRGDRSTEAYEDTRRTLTSGAWFMRAYCESREILTLVSSPSNWMDLEETHKISAKQ